MINCSLEENFLVIVFIFQIYDFLYRYNRTYERFKSIIRNKNRKKNTYSHQDLISFKHQIKVDILWSYGNTEICQSCLHKPNNSNQLNFEMDFSYVRKFIHVYCAQIMVRS